jgi:hypothetical protein
LPVQVGIVRRPGCQAVNITVVHAKCRSNQNGVVDFQIGRPLLSRPLDVRGCDILPAQLDLARNGQQSLELGGNGRNLEVLLDVNDQLFVAAEMVRGCGSMAGLAKVAIVPGRNVGGNQLALAGRERAGSSQQNLRQGTHGRCRLRAKREQAYNSGQFIRKFDVGHRGTPLWSNMSLSGPFLK